MRQSLLAGALAVVFMATQAAAEVKKDVLVVNLLNPSGLAVQPGKGDVFIADSGQLRVLRYRPAAAREERIAVAISGFPKDVYGKGPMYEVGPLGLAFIKDGAQLVVGGGGHPDGEEVMYVFDVTDEKIKADAGKTYGPIGPSEQSEKGEGNFYALAVTKDGILVTSNGDDTKGWVNKLALKDGEPVEGDYKPFIATKEKVMVDAPVGITISPEGELVIGQMGEVNVPGDSLLTVYDAASGELKWSAETGLSDIAALAYHPKSKKLYCLDFAWPAPEEGGLFRLDISEDGEKKTVKAEKIMALDKPAAMAFDAEGNLYITEFGTAKEGDEQAPGRLVKVSGDL